MIRMKARDMLERRMRRGREDVVFTGVGFSGHRGEVWEGTLGGVKLTLLGERFRVMENTFELVG